jgi:hypothetical protein
LFLIGKLSCSRLLFRPSLNREQCEQRDDSRSRRAYDILRSLYVEGPDRRFLRSSRKRAPWVLCAAARSRLALLLADRSRKPTGASSAIRSLFPLAEKVMRSVWVARHPHEFGSRFDGGRHSGILLWRFRPTREPLHGGPHQPRHIRSGNRREKTRHPRCGRRNKAAYRHMPKVLLFGFVADSNSRGLFGFHFARDRRPAGCGSDKAAP